MSGRRFLDLAALFNASRGVAQKHVALRTRQVDVYNRTSTLAKAVRNQTDRVTETVKAASFLASRLNESGPAWTSEASDAREGSQTTNYPILSKEPTERTPVSKQMEGIEQDHFYEKSSRNSSMDPPRKDNLEIQQEKAARYPRSDGTIPPTKSDLGSFAVDHDTLSTRSRDEVSQKKMANEGLKPVSSCASSMPSPARKPLPADSANNSQPQSELQIPSITADADDAAPDPLEEGYDEDSVYRRPTHALPVLSSLPRVKLPKHTSSTQGIDPHLPESQINSDTFYNAGISESIPSLETLPAQDEVPEGVDTALFYSPRIARLLGGKTQGFKQGGDLDLQGVKDSPIDRTDLAANTDQDTFNVRTSSEQNSTVPDDGAGLRANLPKRSSILKEDVEDIAHDISKEAQSPQVKVSHDIPPETSIYELRESKVPTSRLGRIWNYSGLAAGMLGGAVTESLRRVSGSGGEGSFMLSAANMDRLVTKLSRMRGAALKLGQMISFQDSKMLPGPIQEVLQRVQDRADYMPASQRNKVLSSNLGPEWRELFSSFEEKPLAAASIGQVHSAVLKSNGARVAVKVQYPGVAESIDSDLNNLAVLLTASRLLPKGLFLDKTIANARTELAWECDYIREAECGRRFEKLLADDTDVFLVPQVYPEASGKQVLTMEFMDGVGVTRVRSFSQQQKDWIGTQILRLCLREITEFKFMQTDPNWTNFLYNAETNKLELLDFGASREYPKEFITKYTQLLAAASRSDRDTVRDLSIDLGYLTGYESEAMLNAHIASVLTLAEPFLESSPEVYDFRDQTITDRVKDLIPVMIRERLAPPPEETYSLHRKLSGAFLLCARLGSQVRCRELFESSMKKAGIL